MKHVYFPGPSVTETERDREQNAGGAHVRPGVNAFADDVADRLLASGLVREASAAEAAAFEEERLRVEELATAERISWDDARARLRASSPAPAPQPAEPEDAAAAGRGKGRSKAREPEPGGAE